jgi:Leucine-rich repeat (LRR) protein
MTAWLPRKFIIIVLVVGLTSYGAMIVSTTPRRDPEFSGLYRLLEWHDPVTGKLLPLPIDRSAPVDEQILALQKVNELDFGGRQINELPPEIGYLTHLRRLDLSVTPLTKLPPEIGNLSNLQELYLVYSRITTLPPEIGNLSRLRVVDLGGAQITYIPPEFGRIPSLQSVSLYKLPLKEIPPELEQLCEEIYCHR